MTPTDLQAQGIYMASLEVDCPDCDESCEMMRKDGLKCCCADCNNTGRVPRFPTLRQICPPTTVRSINSGKTDDALEDECNICRGRGWLPIVDLATLLAALHKDGWVVILQNSHFKVSDGWLVNMYHLKSGISDGDQTTKGKDPTAAAYRAAAAAIRSER